MSLRDWVERAIANERQDTAVLVVRRGKTLAHRPGLPGGAAVIVDLDHEPKPADEAGQWRLEEYLATPNVTGT